MECLSLVKQKLKIAKGKAEDISTSDNFTDNPKKYLSSHRRCLVTPMEESFNQAHTGQVNHDAGSVINLI